MRHTAQLHSSCKKCLTCKDLNICMSRYSVGMDALKIICTLEQLVRIEIPDLELVSLVERFTLVHSKQGDGGE